MLPDCTIYVFSATGNFSRFSAVCWLYGKYLYGHLKKPLGLIDTAWGGTPVEAWSSPDALERCGLSQTDRPRYDLLRNKF